MPGDEGFVAGACSESWVVRIKGTAVFVRCEDAEGCRSRECGSREVVVNEDTVAGVVPATIMPIGIFFAYPHVLASSAFLNVGVLCPCGWDYK